MRVLVTNDDGVRAPGLHALARAMREEGHEVRVAAPLSEASGAAAAIGDLLGDGAIRYERVPLPGFPEALGVEGPPARAVWAACLGGWGEPPELVVSGINLGHNCGRSVVHSGTVGAALTGAVFGRSGLAVSTAASRNPRWQAAGRLAALATRWLASEPAGTVLNLNCPKRELDELEGVRAAPLASIGTVHTDLVDDGRGSLRLEQRRADLEAEPQSDSALVLAGYATVTPLRPPSAVDGGEAARFLGAALRPVR